MLFDNSIHVPEYIIIKVHFYGLEGIQLQSRDTLLRVTLPAFQVALNIREENQIFLNLFGNCWYVNILSNFLSCRERVPIFTISLHSI